MEWKEPSYTVGGMKIGTDNVENRMEVSLKTIK